MNRKLLAAAGRANGWTGDESNDSPESFKSFLKEKNVGELLIGGKSVTLDQIDAIWKKVTISYDPTDDVEVNQNEQTESVEEDEDPMVDPEAKSLRDASVKRAAEKHARSQDLIKKVNSISVRTSSSGGFSANDAAKMAYDRAVKDGSRLARTGKTPLFLNADRSEYFGAMARLTTMGHLPYAQKSADERIVTKDGSVGVNSLGGALVYNEQLPELIENLESNGAARQAIGVTNMRDGQQTVAKITADVTVYDVGEGDVITSSDPTVGNVSLVASKTAALVKENAELLNDTAFNIGDMLARSISRAVGKYEDEAVFLGQHNRQGISDILTAGGTNVKDLGLSASWSEITIGDIQDTLALLPAWAFEDPKFGFVCSLSFAQSVFYRFGLDAGGNTGANLVTGFGGLRYNGFPIYVSQVMPKSYSANQRSCYMGAWSHACKFGVVSGSEQMATSDQRYFDQDKVAFRYTQRWATNLHDVNATAFASGIVAVQD